MQHDDAWRFERALINVAMKLIVAEMIERDVGITFVDRHLSQRLERAQQRRRIIGHTRPGGGQRRKEADLQSFFRGPNRAVPTRTMVAPSSIATSRSCDIPIDRCDRLFRSASSRSRAK